MNLWNKISNNFYKSVIKDNRYMYILEGLKNTIVISIFAILLGLVIGILVATIRELDKQKNKSKHIAKKICNLYVDFIRGTPSVLQLMIIYYIIFKGVQINILLVGVISFGIGSGAYISEIIRAGISSIDKGQNEAAKTLGLSYYQRMRYIILPQAIKNILPALGNEFISLLKDTSIAGYIGIMDLTKASTIISSRTYDYFFPLVIIAVIYLILVMILTKIVHIFEKRLKND